jgi:hypothetical protein
MKVKNPKTPSLVPTEEPFPCSRLRTWSYHALNLAETRTAKARTSMALADAYTAQQHISVAIELLTSLRATIDADRNATR